MLLVSDILLKRIILHMYQGGFYLNHFWPILKVKRMQTVIKIESPDALIGSQTIAPSYLGQDPLPQL